MYAILRRDGWRTPADLEEAAERSRNVLATELVDDIRWIRTYVFEEPDGGLGTICIYEATDEDAIRRHSGSAQVPATEILPVTETIFVRPDPLPAPA
jgi:hypothetical protein